MTLECRLIAKNLDVWKILLAYPLSAVKVSAILTLFFSLNKNVHILLMMNHYKILGISESTSLYTSPLMGKPPHK